MLLSTREVVARSRGVGSRRGGAAAILAAAVGLFAVPTTDAAVIYVFNTSADTVVPASYLSQVLAQYGTGGDTVINFNAATTAGSIGGAAIRYSAESSTSDVARFFVGGNLNLGATDRVVGYGPKLLSINVGGNSSIASGAVISVAGLGATPGAGGGAGGVGGFAEPATGTRVGLRGEGAPLNVTPVGALTIPGPGRTGSEGGASRANRVPNLRSNAGGAGGSGVNDTWSVDGAGGAGSISDGPYARGGFGGAGGAEGRQGTLNIPGGPGGTGSVGSMGSTGVAGAVADNGVTAARIPFTFDSGQFRGGSGGGGGASGTQGVAGGGGGGGGGGGSGGIPFLVIDPGNEANVGGRGGNGGNGGEGGLGGNGGQGGAGGGGIELIVQGRLTLGSTLTAAGSIGEAGFSGTAGRAGMFGDPGERGTYPESLESGGNGGQGGQGGAGGAGSAGGRGGAGSGGNIHLGSATLTYTPVAPTFNVAGGNAEAGSGTLRVGAFGGADRRFDQYAPTAANVNPFRSNSGVSVFGGLAADRTPNLPDLRGGAEAWGIVTDTVGGTTSTRLGTAFRNSHPTIPSNARAAIWRNTVTSVIGTDMPGYNAMIYVNIGNNIAVAAPRFAAINPDDANGPASPQPLIQGGYMLDARYVAGATGPLVIDSLSNNAGYATLINAGKPYELQGTFTPYVNPRTFKGNSTTVGDTVYLLDTGLLKVDATLPTGERRNFTIDAIDQTLNLSTQIRVGAGQPKLSMAFSNVGNADSLLTAAISIVGGPATPVGQLTPNNVPLIYDSRPNISGLARGQTTSRNALIASDAGNFTANVDYTLVGPVFASTSSTDRYRAGDTFIGETSPFQVTLLNLSPDAAYSADLTALTIFGISITGPDAGAFSLASPGVLDGIRLDNNEGARLNLLFTPLREGNLSATVTIRTDANAAFGQIGTSYSFTISGTSIVPEPTGFLLVGAAALGTARRRRDVGDNRPTPTRAA